VALALDGSAAATVSPLTATTVGHFPKYVRFRVALANASPRDWAACGMIR
jgi:hypothetical protein